MGKKTHTWGMAARSCTAPPSNTRSLSRRLPIWIRQWVMRKFEIVQTASIHQLNDQGQFHAIKWNKNYGNKTLITVD